MKEHTEERRKTRTWVMILTVVVSLFTILELLNLKESYDVREKVEEIVCDDAQDTRTVLRPILDRTLPDVVIPKMPKECR